MIGATLFSGIGAPETAMPHWTWPWHAEIEKFPSAVMAARHPHSINLGDVAADDFAIRARGIAVPDVLVFGSPCQDFSVAGKRLGLDGARGNLALTALRIVGELGPRWFVFENVPGLMSNWSGGPDCPPVTGESIEGVENSDFAAFLGAVDELGYSLAWCRLDAQHFGVAQRRSRVFAVGYLGDWRYPAAVLLEPESLCGDPPARDHARQEVAGAIGAGSARSGQRVGRCEAAAGQLIANSLRARHNDAHDDSKLTYLLAKTLGAGGHSNNPLDENLVTHALRADGFDASEDGTGRGTPLVPICFDTTQITSKTNRCNPQAGDACHPITAEGHVPAIAFDWRASPSRSMNPGNVTDALSGRADRAVAFDMRGREGGSQFEGPHDTANIRAASGGSSRSYVASYGVRRLMPVECERLQGYPDNHTLIQFRGKTAADGPRYKAIGNSMTVPVMRWILSRIERLEQMTFSQAGSSA